VARAVFNLVAGVLATPPVLIEFHEPIEFQDPYQGGFAHIVDARRAEEDRDHRDLVLGPRLRAKGTTVIEDAFAPTEVEDPVVVLLPAH
jgi:hypothetical protein